MANKNKAKTKIKETSEKTLKEEFFHYGVNSWADYDNGNGIQNTSTKEKYFGSDATYLRALISLDEMRRNKVKKSSSDIVASYFVYKPGDMGFTTFLPLLENKGVSVDDFVKKFLKSSKSTSHSKVYDALLKECFPFAVPKHLTNSLYNNLNSVTRSNEGFKGFAFYEESGLSPNDSLDNILKSKKKFYITSQSLNTWISIIGFGLSFHKTMGKYFFSKSESHYFLNAPTDLDLSAAITYAIAYAHSKDHSTSLKVASHNLLGDEVVSTIFNLNSIANKKHNLERLGESRFNYFYNLNPFNEGNERNKISYIHYLLDVIRFLSISAKGQSFKELGEVIDYTVLGFWVNYKEKVLAGTWVCSKHNEFFSKKSFITQQEKDSLEGLDFNKEFSTGYNSAKVIPRFSVLGRNWTFKTIYTDTISWHHDLSRKQMIGSGSWKPLPIDDCYWEIKNSDDVVVETIYVEQLTTASELKEEGSKMRHCVASYASYCRNGEYAIFSMHKETYYGVKTKMATIRVSKNRQIREAKRYANFSLKQEDRQYLNLFASENNLSINNYL